MKINDTILIQYGNSTRVKSLIYSFNDGVKVEGIIDEFYDKIFNLDTANSYGLDVWGKIVNVSRYVKFEETGDVFGFYGQKLQTANNGTFYSGEQATKTLKLSDSFFRSIIKTKAAANISDATIKSLNKLISSIYPEKGLAFVTDNQNMTMNYVFPFYLKANEIALIKNSNVIPRPSGVKLNAIILSPKNVFGFYGTGCQTCNHGTFIDSKGLINVN